MRGFAELAGNEFVVVEVIVREVEAVVGGALFPGLFRAFFRRLGFGLFGAARAGAAGGDQWLKMNSLEL